MKHVIFRRVVGKNFLSIGEEPVAVNFGTGINLITGENKDKPDRQNGVGKSTISELIYFAIFGETLREIKKEFITNNITGGSSHVELDFTVVNSGTSTDYKVVRTLLPSKVYLYQGDQDITRDSISNTTKTICDLINASPAVFQNCIIMNANSATPFMAKNKVEKRKFIEDIFGMEVFSRMVAQLKVEYGEIKRKHDIELSKVDEVSRSYQTVSLQRERSLDKRREKRELYLSRKTSNKETKDKLVSELSSINIPDIESIQLSREKFQEKLVECEGKLHQFIKEGSEKGAKIQHLKVQLSKIGTAQAECPVCLRAITAHDKEHIQLEKSKIAEEILALEAGVAEYNERAKNTKAVKDKINVAINQCNTKILDATGLKQKKQTIIDNIQQLDNWQVELESDIVSVSSNDTEFDQLLVESKERLDALQSCTTELQAKMSKLDIVKYVISEEGVKSYIVNKLLELLNSKLLHYLKKLDANSICAFNEFFEEEIYNHQNKVCSYFNFSGAERKAIDLACLFTFSDIRRMQGGVSYNIAIYDEIFDSSFDEKGIDLIIEILKDRVDTLDECVMIISHRKESQRAVTGETILLEKEGGITRRVSSED